MSTQTTFQELAEAFRALADDLLSSEAKLPVVCEQFKRLAGRASVSTFRAIQCGDLALPGWNEERAKYYFSSANPYEVFYAWPTRVVASVRQQWPGMVDEWPEQYPDLFRWVWHAGKTEQSNWRHIHWGQPPYPKSLCAVIKASAAACDALANMVPPTSESPGEIKAKTEPETVAPEAGLLSPKEAIPILREARKRYNEELDFLQEDNPALGGAPKSLENDAIEHDLRKLRDKGAQKVKISSGYMWLYPRKEVEELAAEIDRETEVLRHRGEGDL